MKGDSSMDESIVQITQPTVKRGEQYSQYIMVDGCKVKLNFLPDKMNGTKNVLDNIRNILLAPNFAK
jgi:hypothetical protein